MKHYTFTICPAPSSNPWPEEPEPDISVTVLLIGKPTLEHVAWALLDAIDFEIDHLYGFHENLKQPMPAPGKRSFSLMADQFPDDCPDEKGVLNTLADELFEPKKTVLFHFDYGDDWRFLVTCDDISPAEKGQKQSRKTLSQVGTFPEQYPDREDEDK